MGETLRILLVCTGNTCRSPLAEAALKRLRPDWEIASAGTQAYPGQPASRFAVQVAEEAGLDLTGHSARTVEPKRNFDRVYVMAPRHLSSFDSGEAELLTTLIGQEREIRDPYGGNLAEYQRAFSEIRECVSALAEKEA